MIECYDCHYFIKYPTGEYSCLMKNNFQIVGRKNVFPKECADFKMGMVM